MSNKVDYESRIYYKMNRSNSLNGKYFTPFPDDKIMHDEESRFARITYKNPSIEYPDLLVENTECYVSIESIMDDMDKENVWIDQGTVEVIDEIKKGRNENE